MYTEKEEKFLYDLLKQLQWKTGTSEQMLMAEIIIKKIKEKYHFDNGKNEVENKEEIKK